MKERPTSVTVLAIINIVLCGLGVLGFIFWLINKLGLIPQPPEKDVLTRAMEDSAVMQLFSDITSVLGIVTTILLLAASISMFTLKPWSRLVTIVLGVYSLILIVVGYTLNFLLITRPLLDSATGTDLVIVRVAMIIGGIISLFFIGYNLLMIYLLTRPHVVEAFTPSLLEEASGFQGVENDPGSVNL